MKLRATVLAVPCLAMHGAIAADYASDLDYYQEFPVVLSASRLRQPLSEAPNAMTVIDRKMIVASGFRSIPDLFKLVPGMYVSYYKGSQAVVSYHGSTDQNARRMQVMIDGRSVYLPPVSTVDWASLPISVDDIERIEVIRGPAAASHGANSTQGVISIVTRNPGGVDAKRVQVTHGSKGINDLAAHLDAHGESLDYRLTLAHSSDHGYDPLSKPPNDMPLTTFQAQGLLNNSNDSNRAQLFNFRGDYHPNGVDRFDIQLGISHDVQGVGFNDRNPSPSSPNSTNGNTFHDLITDAGFVQLGWIRQLQNASELSLTYYHIRQSPHESFPIYLRGVFLADPPVTQAMQTSRDNVELQHTLPLSPANRLVYGAAYRVDRVSAQGNVPALPPAYSSYFRNGEYRLFAHDEWHLDQDWLLNTGAMFERDGLGKRNTSPRAALNFHISPDHTLRAGASVAYRTPSQIELYFPALQPGALYLPSASPSATNLQPEKLLSREVGYLGEFREWGSSLDLRLFSDQVSEGIYVTNQRTFTNGLASTLRGFELTARRSLGGNSDLIVNYARARGHSNAPILAAAGQRYLTGPGPWINDIYSASIPRDSASAMYSRRLGLGWNLSAAYYYQGAMQPFDRGSVDYQAIQRRTDLRLAKTFAWQADIKGEAALVVQNLFDKGYSEYIASNLFNRRAYLTLTLNW